MVPSRSADDAVPDGATRSAWLESSDQLRLVQIAREAVRFGLAGEAVWLTDHEDLAPPLLRPGATFVTLRRHDELLGCIGTMEPQRALADDVAMNARGAAFADPRLPAVTWADYTEMSVKISLLGPLVRLDVDSVDAVRRAARPGVDGLLVADGRHRGTFLPSVWEQVPDPDTFLAMLWQKAALEAGEWPRRLEVYRYETFEFGD